MCIVNNISLNATWIPREQNTKADSLSKSLDTDDWSIDDNSFNHIERTFGVFTMDRFADDQNTKVHRFNSKYHCPYTLNVDAFTTHWGKDFNWLCPPINLIGKTLTHIKNCKAKGVLFVPNWPSKYCLLYTSDAADE